MAFANSAAEAIIPPLLVSEVLTSGVRSSAIVSVGEGGRESTIRSNGRGGGTVRGIGGTGRYGQLSGPYGA